MNVVPPPRPPSPVLSTLKSPTLVQYYTSHPKLPPPVVIYSIHQLHTPPPSRHNHSVSSQPYFLS